MTWMSKIKEVHYKPRKHVSPNQEYGHHLARRRRRRAYAPTSNAVSHENDEKILTPYIGVRLPWRPFWQAELRYKLE